MAELSVTLELSGEAKRKIEEAKQRLREAVDSFNVLSIAAVKAMDAMESFKEAAQKIEIKFDQK